MIEVTDIKKNYGSVQALKGINFSVSRGEIVGLLGPNGAGKTTLMKILTGYLLPSQGRASVSGFDVSEDRLKTQQKIGYLPENAPLYLEMPVQDYLLYMARLRQIPDSHLMEYLQQAIIATGLQKMMTRIIGTLSKGYRQRVGIAQAIVHQPELLILDEPTSGLDPTQIVEIRDLIKTLAEKSTIILSSHILSEVQLTCQRVLMINDGFLKLDLKVDALDQEIVVVVELAQSHQEAYSKLSDLQGVQQVEDLGVTEGYRRFQVTAENEKEGALNRRIFDLVRQHNWDLQQLYRQTRDLEQVFQETVQS